MGKRSSGGVKVGDAYRFTRDVGRPGLPGTIAEGTEVEVVEILGADTLGTDDDGVIVGWDVAAQVVDEVRYEEYLEKRIRPDLLAAAEQAGPEAVVALQNIDSAWEPRTRVRAVPVLGDGVEHRIWSVSTGDLSDYLEKV